MTNTKNPRTGRIDLIPTPKERRIIDRMHAKANNGKKQGERISLSRFIINKLLEAL